MYSYKKSHDQLKYDYNYLIRTSEAIHRSRTEMDLREALGGFELSLSLRPSMPTLTLGGPGPACRTHSFGCTARLLPWFDSRVARVGSNFKPGVQVLHLLASTGGPLAIDLVSSSTPGP